MLRKKTLKIGSSDFKNFIEAIGCATQNVGVVVAVVSAVLFENY